MKTKFRTTLIAGVAACWMLWLAAFNPAKAQYKDAIGLRLSWSYGLTYKHFFSDRDAIEVMAFSRWKGFAIAGLYERHFSFFDVPNLNWYAGGGAHLGFFNGRNSPWWDDNDDYVVIGIDGILGLEYTIPNAPVNLSLDWKPSFNLTGHTGFWGDEGALSVRFVF